LDHDRNVHDLVAVNNPIVIVMMIMIVTVMIMIVIVIGAAVP